MSVDPCAVRRGDLRLAICDVRLKRGESPFQSQIANRKSQIPLLLAWLTASVPDHRLWPQETPVLPQHEGLLVRGKAHLPSERLRLSRRAREPGLPSGPAGPNSRYSTLPD